MKFCKRGDVSVVEMGDVSVVLVGWCGQIETGGKRCEKSKRDTGE